MNTPSHEENFVKESIEKYRKQLLHKRKAEENVVESIEKYRTKLLDTTKRNPLISFKHSPRSRQHIRLIDELPDFLYEALVGGKILQFRSLPEESQIPADEKTPDFIRHFEQAKITDEAYNEALEAIDEE